MVVVVVMVVSVVVVVVVLVRSSTILHLVGVSVVELFPMSGRILEMVVMVFVAPVVVELDRGRGCGLAMMI